MSLSVALAPPPSLLAGLNLKQQQAVLANGHVQVLAGPGTGKTEILARRYVWLWLQLQAQYPQADPLTIENKLLVVTFTNKSAQEMKERIAQRLASVLGVAVPLTGQWIGTFHQICPHWLTDPPTLLDSYPQFLLDEKLVQQVATGQLADVTEALTACGLHTHIAPDVLSLTAMAALPLPKVMDVLADLPHLIDTIQGAGLLPLAFYHQAMAQTQAFTQCLQQLPAAHPITQHPFASATEAVECWHQHLRPFAAHQWQPVPQGWSADALKPSEVFNYADCKPLKEVLLGKKVPKTGEFMPLDTTSLKQQLASRGQIEQQLIAVIAAYYAVRWHHLAQQNQCDYDGLLLRALAHVQQPAPITQQFAGIIVDECQDTNPLQCQLLAPFTPSLGLMVVGDAKQSIYGFRHAEPDNLQQLTLGRTPLTTVALTQNYRSLPDIVHTFNALAHHCQLDASPPLQPATKEVPPNIPAFEQIDLDGDNIGDQRSQEGQAILAALKQHGQTTSWADMAVLCQTHHRAMGIYTMLMQAGIPARLDKLPTLFKQPAVHDTMAVATLLIHLALPGALEGRLTEPVIYAWVRLLECHLTDQQLYVLAQTVQQQRLSWSTMLVQGLYNTQQVGPWPHQLVAVLQQAAQGLEVGLITARIELVLEQLALLERYADNPLQLEAFSHWQCLAHTLQAEGLLMWQQQFTHWASNSRLIPDYPLDKAGQGQAVTLLTAHSAKGLEFKVVYVAWTDPSKKVFMRNKAVHVIPASGRFGGMGVMLAHDQGANTLKHELARAIWLKPRQAAEQKRVFYVALSRAKQVLRVYRSANSDAWTDVASLSDL
jgi:ATP-dependent helicase/nuclease subunit A